MFISWSFANLVRCAFNRIVKLIGKPQWAHDTDVMPHPVMIIFAIFMSVRFAYLD